MTSDEEKKEKKVQKNRNHSMFKDEKQNLKEHMKDYLKKT